MLLSLVQSTTEQEIESDLIATLKSPTDRLLSPLAISTDPTETIYDSTDDESSTEEDEMSVESSDWDSLSDAMYSPTAGHSRINSFSSNDQTIHTNQKTMNWSDNVSVNKFKALLSQILLTSSYGIREDELYLMFSSPTPQEIIQQLKSGVLSDICKVKTDSCGRHSFYYNSKKDIHYTLSVNDELPSELNSLCVNDDSLMSFIEDTPCPPTPQSLT